MKEFYETLIHFFEEELPAVERAIDQEKSLSEKIRLQRVRGMMKELLDLLQLYTGKGEPSD